MPTQSMTAVPPPLLISQISFPLWGASTLLAAVELDLFDALKDGENSANAVASKLKLNPKGTGLLLDALTALNLLEKNGDRYRLTELTKIYLLRGSNLYLGEHIKGSHRMMAESWGTLAERIRSGVPAQEVNKEEIAEQFFPQLADNIFPLNFSIAQMVAEKFLQNLPKNARVLDVAAGSAVWSIPIAQSEETVRVDALDFPKVLEITRKRAKQHSVEKQFNYLSGDWRAVTLDPKSYDVILIGHLLHSEGRSASEELLRKLHSALKPGGKLIVAEFMPNDARTGPVFPVMFAINMYLQTTEGCVFTFSELKDLLERTGYSGIDRPELPNLGPESPIVVATKK
jgi:ubiquinone/menaquinone biosynthesis C-methylase UbiE